MAPPAWGGPSDIAVRVRCPVLTDVAAAEFEARAKVDLSARSTRGGELEVVCDDSAARLRWRQKGGAWWARSIPPPAAPAAFVDGLLRTSEELVEESLRFEGVLGENAPKEEPALPDPAGPRADATPDEDADADKPKEPNKPTRKAAPPPDTATPESRVSPDDDASARAGPRATWMWGGTVGVDATFGLKGAAVGPRVGVFAELPATFVLQLTGEYAFGTDASDAVAVRMAGVSALISKRFGRQESFELGAGLVGGSVFVNANGSIQPPSLAEFYGGLVVRGRLGLREGGWRFAAGPEVRFNAFRPEVAVNHDVVWNVPAVGVGLGVEVSGDIFGSR